jgi:hypothetical protein
MATLAASYASSATITITLASLASGSARASTVVNNSSNLYVDALVGLKVKANAAGTSSSGQVNVYLYASADAGTNYSDGASGSDAAHTLNKNARLVHVMALDANAETAKAEGISVAQAFGYMPEKWGVIIENQSGAALDSTGGNHEVHYTGVKFTSS